MQSIKEPAYAAGSFVFIIIYFPPRRGRKDKNNFGLKAQTEADLCRLSKRE